MRKKIAARNAAFGRFQRHDFCTLNVDKIVRNASHIVKER